MAKLSKSTEQKVLRIVKKDDVASLKALVEAGLNVDREVRGNYWEKAMPLLSYASQQGSLAIVRFLIKAGARLEEAPYRRTVLK
jgi:hypothetical protein